MCCRLNSCCCFDLRTGGYIIGLFGLISSFFIFITLNTNGIASCVIYCIASLLTSSTLLYGIHYNKPLWMLLSIILKIAAVVIIVVASIIILFTVTIIVSNEDNHKDTEYSRFSKNHEKHVENLSTAVIVTFIIIYAVYLSWEIYIATVLISLYKQIMENPESGRTRPVGFAV